jgi:hypothetical protein
MMDGEDGPLQAAQTHTCLSEVSMTKQQSGGDEGKTETRARYLSNMAFYDLKKFF